MDGGFGTTMSLDDMQLWMGVQDGDLRAVADALRAGKDLNKMIQMSGGYGGGSFSTTYLIESMDWDQQRDNSQAMGLLLLRHGADPNLPNSNGMTPLMVAAKEGGHTKLLNELIERGAELDAATNAPGARESDGQYAPCGRY